MRAQLSLLCLIAIARIAMLSEAFSSGVGVRASSTRFCTALNSGAAADARTSSSLGFRLADALMATLFRIKPLYELARKNARDMIVKRAALIGRDFNEEVSRLEKVIDQIQEEYSQLYDPNVDVPAYYQRSFHAYDEGNLCWEAALENEPAALTVHANLFSDTPQADGDMRLRQGFHDRMLEMLTEQNFEPKTVLDLGCSTGLSTLALHRTFPNAHITGLDLSPYMLAVAAYKMKTDDYVEARKYIKYIHAAAEDTKLPAKSVDLVTISLVNHELPTSAARQIFQEAYRVLRPGGALAVMDMDPQSSHFKRVLSKPFVFAAFKSTEPYLDEYMSMNVWEELEAVGFILTKVKSSSPRHRTVVAFTSS